MVKVTHVKNQKLCRALNSQRCSSRTSASHNADLHWQLALRKRFGGEDEIHDAKVAADRAEDGRVHESGARGTNILLCTELVNGGACADRSLTANRWSEHHIRQTQGEMKAIS